MTITQLFITYIANGALPFLVFILLLLSELTTKGTTNED